MKRIAMIGSNVAKWTKRASIWFVLALALSLGMLGACAQQGGEPASVDGSESKKTQEISAKSLEEYSWEELAAISEEIAAAPDEAGSIEVAKRYNLCTPEGKLDGTQVKSVTLADGTQTTVQIAGFAHDDKTGGGKAGITFIFGDCVGEATMNPTETNAGGWEASQMRAYLNGEWRAELPEDLNVIIVPVDKLTNNTGETQSVSSVSATSDSLWLFSCTELAGPIPSDAWADGYEYISDIFNAEGAQYQLFKDEGVVFYDMFTALSDDENLVLRKTFQGSPRGWFERSPMPADPGFLYTSDGVVSRYEYGTPSLGAVPGFCI